MTDVATGRRRTETQIKSRTRTLSAACGRESESEIVEFRGVACAKVSGTFLVTILASLDFAIRQRYALARPPAPSLSTRRLIQPDATRTRATVALTLVRHARYIVARQLLPSRREERMPNSKCMRCGSGLIADGALYGPGRMALRPEGARFLAMEMGHVMTKATMCRECGFVEITGDVQKLRRLTTHGEPESE